MKAIFKKCVLLYLGILFFLSSLLPNFTEQLQKLPSLLNHYAHHQAEHEVSDFASFLFLHYGDQSAHKSEENHEDLPLFQMSNFATLLIMQELPVFAFIPQDITQVPHQHFLDQTYSFTRIGGIFQPPRLA
jgi:hypothetical protein